jgi:enamidase
VPDIRRLVVTGAGTVLSGDLAEPVLPGVDTVVCRDGTIAAVGTATGLAAQIAAADQVLDAHGSTVAPGLVDSHCHVAFGDYTPRQQAVGFLGSYLHGGVTTAISAGEVHVPGRPRDREGVKAMAVAAQRCFRDFRPSGMRVYAGCVLLEPELTESDFADLAERGVRLAKFGFGRYADPMDGVPQLRWARRHGLVVTCHAGGASVPGSASVTAEHVLALDPDVCGHANGGPTALPDADVDRLVLDSGVVLQIVQAGNLRAAVRLARLASDTGNLHRLVLGSDTPSGVGVIPLALLKTVAELSSLAGLDPAVTWALATGNCATVWGLPAGRLRVGAVADLLVLDAPVGSAARDALGALAAGDLPGVSAVVTAGALRVLGSRNTPRATRAATASPPTIATADR